MERKNKSLTPHDHARLGSFVIPNKAKVEESLSQFKKGVKTKQEVEAIADVFFESMRRFDVGVK